MNRLEAEALAMRYTSANADPAISYSAKRSHVLAQWYVAEYKNSIQYSRIYAPIDR